MIANPLRRSHAFHASFTRPSRSTRGEEGRVSYDIVTEYCKTTASGQAVAISELIAQQKHDKFSEHVMNRDRRVFSQSSAPNRQFASKALYPRATFKKLQRWRTASGQALDVTDLVEHVEPPGYNSAISTQGDKSARNSPSFSLHRPTTM